MNNLRHFKPLYTCAASGGSFEWNPHFCDRRLFYSNETIICIDATRWRFPSSQSLTVPASSLPGAPLKVCPQGFSCCTVEMEEKLSQQSHTEIKAPVSRLSTNLQSTFRQRHDHFDSKQTHSAKQTHTHTHQPLFRLQCAARVEHGVGHDGVMRVPSTKSNGFFS